MARTGRPPKDKRQLKSIPLRIMLTVEQRELIEQAASAEGLDMTAWARPILLQAAKEKAITKEEKPKRANLSRPK